MRARIVLWLACITTFLSTRHVDAEEGPVVIRNQSLEVRADRKTGEITILAKGKPVVTGARIVSAGKSPKVVPLHNDLPGVISCGIESSDGRFSAVISLPGEGHFVLIQSGLYNNTAEPRSVTKLGVFRGHIALPDNGRGIRLLGTGGLVKSATSAGSYMWLAAAEPEGRGGLVAGFVSTDRGSGVVFAGETDHQLRIDAQIEYGRLLLKPEERSQTENFVVGYFDDVRDGLEAWADKVAEDYKIKLPPQPSGYCTWYHAGALNEVAMVKQAEIAAKELKPYGFDFLQIDDGWQDGIKSNGPRKNFTRVRPDGPYPSGMKKTANMIRSNGLTPGIWFMPFAGTWTDPWFKEHQDWFVKRGDGSPYDTAWGGTCMDMTNPDTRKYLAENVHRMAHDWGYRFFKMDGLSTGCGVTPQYVNLGYKDDHVGDAVFHDPSKTNIEVFRSGLKLLREAAGPDVFLLGCCAPQNMRSYGGAFGLVNAMRVGPDNNGRNWRLHALPDRGLPHATIISTAAFGTTTLTWSMSATASPWTKPARTPRGSTSPASYSWRATILGSSVPNGWTCSSASCRRTAALPGRSIYLTSKYRESGTSWILEKRCGGTSSRCSTGTTRSRGRSIIRAIALGFPGRKSTSPLTIGAIGCCRRSGPDSR